MNFDFVVFFFKIKNKKLVSWDVSGKKKMSRAKHTTNFTSNITDDANRVAFFT